MRKKDASKKSAIFHATLELVNEVGFSYTSVSKIAHRANISPGTLYTYFENKDQVLLELFLDLKQRMLQMIVRGISDDMSTEQWFRKLWRNVYEFYLENSDAVEFCEHFKHTPHMRKVSQERLQEFVAPIQKFFQRSIAVGDIKPLSEELVHAFVFYPIVKLARDEILGFSKSIPELRQKAEDLAWQILAS